MEGAGTVPVNENAALNGPWWVTSVPIRSQSAASVPGPSFRIQLCRSAANGVPGDTIGFGAESQRKSPALPWVDLSSRVRPRTGGTISVRNIGTLRRPGAGWTSRARLTSSAQGPTATIRTRSAVKQIVVDLGPLSALESGPLHLYEH